MEITDFIYRNSPIYVQNMICSAYGHFEKRKRFSKEFFTYLDWLEESQYWGSDKIYEYKLKELQKIYQHAYSSVPFYRNRFKAAGLNANAIKDIEDFAKVPILEKEDVRNNWKDLVSLNNARERLFHRNTSGSSGKALDFYVTKRSTSLQWAVWWRFRKNFEVDFGDKSLNFIGKKVVPINQSRPPFWRVNSPMNQHLVNMQHMKAENIKYFVDYINREQFVFFSGYPSIIYSFCNLVENLGLIISNPPRIVFAGAEKVLEYQKMCIERVLGCMVTDHYGFSEGAGNASRCKHGIYHEDFELGHLEPRNPKKISQTSFSGEILATGFTNYGMPFIRYNVGDNATWGSEKCTCGRHSAILLNIEGRNEDHVITPENTSIVRFGFLFRNTKNIEECQVVQYKLGEVTFRIVKRDTFSIKDEVSLKEKVREWISPTILVNFEYVDEIERTDSGKFKAVVSYLNGEENNLNSF